MCRHAYVFLKILWLAAVAACVTGTSSVPMPLFATCCLPSSRCFHQCSQSPDCFLCSGIILVRFELIHLIFVFVKVYDGIHNSLLAISVLWCTGPLFLSSACLFYDVLVHCSFLLLTSCVYTCGLECFSDKGNIEGTSWQILRLCMYLLCLCRDGFCEFDLSKGEEFSSVHLCMMELVVLLWLVDRALKSSYQPLGALHEIRSASYKFRPITSPFDPVLNNLWVPYMISDVHPNTNACMLSTCTCVLKDTVTGCGCCLCSRDKFSSHASLLATCCLRSSWHFDQHSQSPCCFLFRYCKVWTDSFSSKFMMGSTIHCLLRQFYDVLVHCSFFCWPLVFTLVVLMLLWQRQHWRD